MTAFTFLGKLCLCQDYENEPKKALHRNGNRNYLAENSKTKYFGVQPNKRKDQINCTEQCRDQIEGCANAANMSAVWKHLKMQMQKSLQASTASNCFCISGF